ncbi:MAG: M23 family metallopeptidase [Caldilineaceae bacterium]
MWRWWPLLVIALVVVTLAFILLRPWRNTAQLVRLRAWIDDPAGHAAWSIQGGQRCANALMLLPTTGYIGFGWNDSFRPGHHHSGLDIFSPDGQTNVTPVFAAYDGYLTREADWKSTVIIRHPDFPAVEAVGIRAGEQIWSYYTHMAARDGATSFVAPEFPPGVHEIFVRAGTLLGHQGNWGGSPLQLTGLHLHFSLVKSTDNGGYRDERELANTYNPIALLGLTEITPGIWGCAIP